MILKKSKAIILRKIPYGEGDMVATLLSEEGSRLDGFAARAKLSVKRFGGGFDLFNQLEIVYREKNSNLVHIQSAELIGPMPEVRRDLSKFAAACYFAEIILVFLQEKEISPEIYRSFSNFLTELNKPSEISASLIPLMEHQFLNIFGFKPTLTHCLECRATLEPDCKYYFSGIKGGIVCEKCAGPNLYPLSYSTLSQVLKSYDTNPKAWRHEEWKPHNVSQARKAFEYFIQYTTGRPLKSLPFLCKIFA